MGMKPQVFTLKNGLQVILVDTKAFPTLTTILLVGAGSRYENKDNNGVAHFFEHMAFKGSKKYPNTQIISSTIEGLGGVFNAFTSKDHTGYWIKSTNEHFTTVIDVIADMIKNPLLVEQEIEREKGVIVEEINMYEDMPARKVGDLFEELLYDGNSLGFDIAGQKRTVKSFNRTTFTDYIRQLYYPNNSVLIVAGGLGNKTNYLKTIEDKFDNWKEGKADSFDKLVENQTKTKILIKHKKTEQAHFCLGYRAFSFFDKRRYALTVLATILGGGMSSRLFSEVREKRGLCYYISTGRESYHDTGYISTQAGVTNDLGKIKEAIKVIIEEHKKMVKGEITKDEIVRAKELIKGRMLLSLEDSFNVAYFYGIKKILENSLQTPSETIDKIEKVSPDDIVSVASDLFKPERLNFALVGPFVEGDFQAL
jgi:predicted Zn-dependent peptidase